MIVMMLHGVLKYNGAAPGWSVLSLESTLTFTRCVHFFVSCFYLALRLFPPCCLPSLDSSPDDGRSADGGRSTPSSLPLPLPSPS